MKFSSFIFKNLGRDRNKLHKTKWDSQGRLGTMEHHSFSPPKSAAVLAVPEFADHHTARALFGLSRSYLYKLAAQRRIRSVCIRRPGALKGRRLFDCASIRAFLDTCSSEAESTPTA